MTNNRITHIMTLTSLMAISLIIPAACQPLAETPPTIGVETVNLRATAIAGQQRAVILNGPWTFENEIKNCTYQHPNRRTSYWLQISWGDGAVSDLKSGPYGDSCADMNQHTYSKPGHYQIAVKINGLGPADGPLSIYSGQTTAIIP